MLWKIVSVAVVFVALYFTDNDHNLDWLDWLVNGFCSLIWGLGLPDWLAQLFDVQDEEYSADDDGGY